MPFEQAVAQIRMLHHSSTVHWASTSLQRLSVRSTGLRAAYGLRCFAGIPKIKNLIPEDTPELREWKEREKRVVKEQMTRSKLSDAKSALTEKLFIAPPDIVAPLAENEFPATEMVSVSTNESATSPSVFSRAPATIVTVAFQGHSQQQLQPWLQTILTHLRPEPAFAPGQAMRPDALQHVNLLYLQGWFFKTFSGLIVRSTRRSFGVPALAEASAVTFQPSQRDMDHWADKLRIVNRMQGHILLVDRAGIVRWQAHGIPGPGELDNMVHAAQTLMAAAAGLLKPPRGAFNVTS